MPAPPTTNIPVKTQPMFTPIAEIVSRSSTPARTIAPTRVRVSAPKQWVSVELTVPTRGVDALPKVDVSYQINEDARQRALPLRRVLLPFAKPQAADASAPVAGIEPAPVPELAGGNWSRDMAFKRSPGILVDNGPDIGFEPCGIADHERFERALDHLEHLVRHVVLQVEHAQRAAPLARALEGAVHDVARLLLEQVICGDCPIALTLGREVGIDAVVPEHAPHSRVRAEHAHRGARPASR